MKNNFHNDVDNENLSIAQKILTDSKKINTDNVFDQKLLDNIETLRTDTRIRFSKKKLYAFCSAAAACIICIVGIAYFNNGFIPMENSKNSGTIVFDTDSAGNTSTQASDYTEIYNRLKLASGINIFYEGNADTFSSNDTADASSSSGAAMEQKNSAVKESASTSLADSAENYYATNEQTENVHEGDIVKTDGKYIYTLSYKSKKDLYKIVITKADGMNLENMSEITFDGEQHTSISEIYVNDNTLTAIGSKYIVATCGNSYGAISDVAYPEENETIIYTYDISDRQNPKLLSRNVQDGSYVSSRMSNGFLYTISDKYMYEVTKEDCVPSVNGKRISPDCIYLPEYIDNTEYTLITALDINNSSDFSNSIAVAGSTSTVYASQNNLYLISNVYTEKDISDTSAGKKYLSEESSVTIYDNETVKVSKRIKKAIGNYYDDIDVKDITAYRNTAVYKSKNSLQILKYSYNNDNVDFIADTTVDGYSYDNLCFDEKDGYLRLVSTESSNINISTRVNYYSPDGNLLFHIEEEGETVKSDEETNNVFVLDEVLNTVAEINNLAEGESIYSARFLGDYGYFVTYENTDPLFSVDFSDMENPAVIGKLKLPGFSDYLHFYTDNKLLGFGVDTDESTGNWESLKLEMYDISGGNASVESKKVLENYEDSSALYNYKAIMVDSSKGFIGFIATSYDEDYDEHSSYLLYTYENNEFKQILELDLDDAYDVRGFYINDYLYIVDPDFGIRVLNLNTYTDDQKVGIEKF